ncbi:uncharacterized protein LOC132177235 [Corylus avellana]|uniref:uncharacterized protein LOC132177235 n=1 Tax=Corylus avellana TaxID=13451 RepID=UPI00286CE60B|nr:uncharacterized protein LOC132177235 [Corylus avellana]
MAGLSAGLSALIVIVLVYESCSADDGHRCAPSSCGDIHNISYPFRLQHQPQNCGLPNYTLSCDSNYQTVLDLYAGKYYVRQINYENYTIRVVDSGIHHLSIPLHFLNSKNFSDGDPYTSYESYPRWRSSELSEGTVVFLMCENPVNSPFYLEASTCFSNNGEYSSNSSKMYRYVKVGRTKAADVEDSCQIDRMVPTSWPGNIACSDVHNALEYGFELSWLEFKCNQSCGSGQYCSLDDANGVHCERRYRYPLIESILRYVFSYGEASLSKKLVA